MNRPALVLALFVITAASLGAQDGSQSSPYEGTSAPPPDDTIVTTVTVRSKPAPGQQVYVESSVPVQSATPGQLAAAGRTPAAVQTPGGQPSSRIGPGMPPVMQGDDDVVPVPPVPTLDLTDDGPVQPASTRTASVPAAPTLSPRVYPPDPDGDIVQPAALRPGELGPGTTIRVRLMHKLSTDYTERGEAFRTRVASDVVRGSEVLIPAGAEIDGRVVEISKGHTGGHGTMRLRPETVIMPGGTSYRLYAEVTATPGTGTRIGTEGMISPGSRIKRDGVEYGAAVGGGAVTGAFVGGPIGALTGGLVGAGFVTVHLLLSHPQATLDSGSVLQFTLTEPLYLSSANVGMSEN